MCGDINVEKLIKRRKTQDEEPVYYAIMEDKYAIISRGHITTDHGGRGRMLKHLCLKGIRSIRPKTKTSQVICQNVPFLVSQNVPSTFSLYFR